jgi:CRP-like cAMP-binding protein
MPALIQTPTHSRSPRPAWLATPQARPDFQCIKPKARLYKQGEQGPIWRVAEGVLALEADAGEQGDERRLAGLALPGDLIGAEQLVDGHYAWSARALVPCQLLTWRPDTDGQDAHTVLRGLVAAQRRSAALLALRSGTAQERVVRLVRLMSQGTAREGTVLPTLRDMSLITTISAESICRELARLRTEGRLSTHEGRHILHEVADAGVV